MLLKFKIYIISFKDFCEFYVQVDDVTIRTMIKNDRLDGFGSTVVGLLIVLKNGSIFISASSYKNLQKPDFIKMID